MVAAPRLPRFSVCFGVSSLRGMWEGDLAGSEVFRTKRAQSRPLPRSPRVRAKLPSVRRRRLLPRPGHRHAKGPLGGSWGSGERADLNPLSAAAEDLLSACAIFSCSRIKGFGAFLKTSSPSLEQAVNKEREAAEKMKDEVTLRPPGAGGASRLRVLSSRYKSLGHFRVTQSPLCS